MSAQQEQKRKFGGAFCRYLEELAYYPRCSNNKTAHLVRPRQLALKYNYIQANRSGQVSWLIFDLDHPNSMIWDDQDLPSPNFVVRNRKNNHAHLFYAISPVCTTENARSHPIAFMKAVYKAMALRLDADTDYSGPVAKTPHHPWWETTEFHAHEYSLGELAEYLDLVPEYPHRKVKSLGDIPESRHCYLFHDLRHFAYSIVEEYRERHTFSAFSKALDRFARSHNKFRDQGFDADLPDSSIRATVRSVSRWTWDRYRANFVRRGAMRLDPSLPLQERQSLSARRTNKIRTNISRSRIAKACRELLSLGRALTIKDIAEKSGLSRQTVAKHSDVLSQNYEPPHSSGHSEQAEDVNYAVHQITAVSKNSGEVSKAEASSSLCGQTSGKPPP